ncbi:MAG TPA: YbaK/EbsC family protein [Phycisphaerae bacterium]|nr:YbaK/EbsC family protein [Phycisphaerae bacterium]
MADESETTVPGRIVDLLERHQVLFDRSSHRPVYTSADAAEVRGESLHSGAKALLVKTDSGFVLLVLPGDCKLDSKATKRLAGSKSLRFATREEVAELTGLEPGSIPPFGSLFGLPTFCDAGLAECEQINFNAGAHTESIRMRYQDYQHVESPTVGAFSRPAS